MAALFLILVLLLTVPLLAQPEGDARKGQDLYLEKCTLCHGSQGEGWNWSKKVAEPPIPIPDLSKVAPKLSDQYLFDIVRDGGEAVGKTRFMPPFGFQLSDKEVWDLVAYIRSLGGKTQ